MPSISVCMMVQNAEKTLAIALESLNYVYDELIIVDGGSNDGTCDIALRYGSRIIHSPWTGNHSQQRNIYLQEVKTDWVFVLDSDEFIDKETLNLLINIKEKGNALETQQEGNPIEVDNLWITRKWISPFSKQHYIAQNPHYPDPQRRLFKYNKNLYYSGEIHEFIHELKHSGVFIEGVSIYHLDLFINSELCRKQKVMQYSQVTSKDGMPHYYLPNTNDLKLKKWKNKDLLPSVKKILDNLPMKCKICEAESLKFANSKLLNKYYVDYFQCSSCGFIQTEEPYWLKEAYSSPIAKSDVGLVFRNTNFSRITSELIFKIFAHEAKFLDYGGGYGLFVRMMRDMGFDFYWHDTFCPNLFALGFEVGQNGDTYYELVTAFEVFEHFVNPLPEIEKILKFSKNILFSTELLPDNNPKPHEWWYYAPEEGQHISLYTNKALLFIAEKFSLNLYSKGSTLHLLTEKKLSASQIENLFRFEQIELEKESLISKDYLKALAYLDDSETISSSNKKKQERQEASKTNIKIIVDGVFFQLYQTGIARLWKSLLEEWSDNDFGRYLVILDRAGTAPKISGLWYRTVSQYDYNNTEADRSMLQQVCDEEEANLFISTYYTTPLSTPSVFMAYDMIPEYMGWDLNHPMWVEKHYGIKHGCDYIAISENTANDLANWFPEIPVESITIAHSGVKAVFSPANVETINYFKNKYGITRPYFILVGAGSGYKNSILFFKAFAQLVSKHGFEIVCTGSGTLLEPEFRTYTLGSAVHMLQLSDEELRVAYSGAVALIYPSKYEGFGLPVLEAMACACPVITCPNASIPEVAGEAAIYVNDEDVDGMVDALCEVQKPDIRKSLIAAGLQQAQKFSWSKMARIVSSVLIDATLRPLKLKDINLIIFPNWSQSEDSLEIAIERVLAVIANHPDRSKMTILIDTNGISEEDANLALSGIVMNLLMQGLDVTEGLEISLVSNLEDIQWEALLPRLKARIILENENEQAIAKVKAGSLPSCDLDSLLEMRTLQ
ncbi:glycosyltransferase [Microcoleus sp. FACHB-1]|nr:glycosyltransferase [Microcoleus sp. FACHB-1]